MTDLTPDEIAAHWEKVRRAMEPLPARDLGNGGEAVLEGWRMPTRNPPEPKTLSQRPARVPPADGQRQHAGWDAWTRWAEEINARIHAFTRDHASVETIAEAVGTVLKDERKAMRAELKTAIAALEDRVAKDAEATVSLLMEMERRVDAIEKTAIAKTARPRLIGGSDAA